LFVSDLPVGTVTFVFSDIEGSTRLLNELGADAYAEALAEHRRVLREGFDAHGGVEVDTQGDAFFYAFAGAKEAVAAAAGAQKALRAGPIAVRIGVHTGEPLLTGEGYIGLDVHKAARICSAGHGGQVLLSQVTRQLIDLEVRDLGEHRLKDLSAPERIFQLGEADFPPLKTLYRTNLPVPATSFLGRERELEALARLIEGAHVRLLTLTGAGGTGKTRLALQTAAAAADSFPDGVFWVALAALRDPQLVLEQASLVLEGKNGLAEHIADKRLLLLFDNFEHLIEAGSGLADLLTACPNVKLMVTSRESLHLSAEREYPVPPLEEAGALELFRERGSALAAEVTVNEDVAAICRQLDFLPLAIELAAARVKSMSPREIRRRLERHLPVLATGPRDAPERQRTLRSTIEWSYALLTRREQEAFARFAVFAGGAELDAIEAICGADIDDVASLVDKSLLRKREDRYWMLETIREYAEERLEKVRDAATVQARHAHVFNELAAAAGAALEGPKSSDMMEILESEHPNIRVALRWGLNNGQQHRALAAVAGIWRFWEIRGHAVEGMRWLDEVLVATEATNSGRLDALRGGVALARLLGQVSRAQALAEEMLALARRGDDVRMTGIALAVLGTSAGVAGDLEGATSRLKEARELLQQTDDEFALGHVMNHLAYTALAMEDFPSAATYSRESLEVSIRIGDATGRSIALANLGLGQLLSGTDREAEALFIECLTHSDQIGYEECVAYSYEGLAAVAVRRGNGAKAARLLGAAEILRATTGTQLELVERAVHDNVVAQLESLLSPGELTAEWAAGREATREEAIAYAMSVG
jgi:predicted ATPase